ncbi:LysM peptidoglycan-binding domain-containing protein [Microbacterium sp. APC 3901]|uniref:LysM peptidoglycan-binding domain-containing protein n=1 Tax=Microbacterium sp. APC 3901 TaxID=3035192 RepID=UPI0025B4615C|nr:LysM peptidoglycan-binding domain-containing protein [Microbacterium sp. APC 3901]MDN3443774.1 LysM peptidoglycan-binding domain-containing protein [Microbacterium sp. APC 3901]
MSTITFSSAAVLPARPATRLRLTVRGRRLVLAVAAVPLAVGIAFAALSGGSAMASGEQTTTASFATVTVMPGDTLWSIAESIAPGADPRDVIGDITRLNLLRGGSLQIGQELAIPAQYSE